MEAQPSFQGEPVVEDQGDAIDLRAHERLDDLLVLNISDTESFPPVDDENEEHNLEAVVLPSANPDYIHRGYLVL